MRVRRLKKTPAELEVTAFINLIVVLVPFLLSTAVFSKLAVLELALPAPAGPGVEQLAVDKLQLEVVLRADALEVGDRLGGLIQRLPATTMGMPDAVALGALADRLKARFPDASQASVLAEAGTPYAHIVMVMDALRERREPRGRELVVEPRFPRLAIGDAPARRPEARP